MKKSFLSNQQGLTLLEILIVLGIIAAVLGGIVPKIMQNNEKANIQQTRMAMNNVLGAATQYYNDCSKAPENIDALVTADASCPNWGPTPYLKEKDTLDKWGGKMIVESEEGEIVVRSLGKDKKSGGKESATDLSTADGNK